jgi:hypothetical protein
MNQVKDFLNFVDIIVGTFWGFTVLEIFPILNTGTTIVFTQIDNIIKISFAFVGLVYAIVRLVNFFHMARLNRDYRKQEIIEKERKNLYYNWTEEFNNQSKLNDK